MTKLERRSRRLSTVAAIATPLAIVGTALVLFFNPIWIAFAQDRAGVPSITGYTPDEVRTATGSILWDLIVGPPEFDIAIAGEPVLGAAERSHMADVRGVLLVFGAVALLAGVVLVGILATRRRDPSVWRATGRSAAGLTIAGLVAGVVILLFFDAAFLAFHLVFFPQGNFSFDPRVARLTQLFPEQVWTETAITLAAAILLLSSAVALGTLRRAATLTARR